MLELAQDLGNVSVACKQAGYSRDTYYRVRARFLKDGLNGLYHKSKKNERCKQFDQELQILVRELSLLVPECGKQRLAKMLGLVGKRVSATTVQKIWANDCLTTQSARKNEARRRQRESSAVKEKRVMQC